MQIIPTLTANENTIQIKMKIKKTLVGIRFHTKLNILFLCASAKFYQKTLLAPQSV